MRTSLLALGALLTACGAPPPREPSPAVDPEPVAAARPHEIASPHGTRVDPYFWLRDDSRANPEVLAYLRAENAYHDRMLAPVAALRDTLYAELVSRIEEDDQTPPTFDDGYWYYARYEKGRQYPIYARRKGAIDAPEEIVLDGNALAEGHAFYKIGGWDVTRDGRRVAWAEDTVGRNQYTIRVKDLTTGEVQADTVGDVAGSVVWASDGETFFYVGKDPTTLRERSVWRRRLGEAEGTLVYDEPDEAFYTSIAATKSRAYVAITLWSTVSTEVRLVDADDPARAPRLFEPRERDHEYGIDHLDGRFVIHTNWQAKNFRLMEVADGADTGRARWREVVPHDPDVLVEDFSLYRGFTAVEERTGGLPRIRVLPVAGAAFEVAADEPTFAMYLYDTPDPDSKVVRYGYQSMTTPATVYDLDVATRARTTIDQQQVRGGFDRDAYVTEYVHATAEDGTRVPISLVRRKDTPRDGTAPLLLYGYGSYGATMDATFSTTSLSLLDRGWVFAIAHVRGGQELGRAWYEAGRQLAKKNTFTDFIACAEHLVAARYAAPDEVFAMGGSAGGLLIGAVINLRPELFRGAIAAVPFVDVVTTMLDTSIPLTTNEFDEWGDPRRAEFYEYMLSYSPYDQVRAQAYPSLLVTTGLWDSQVQYFEPAKWVAKLRATRTDDNLLLLHTEMEAGHGGKSGRYEALRETARDWAFLLHVLERPDTRAR